MSGQLVTHVPGPNPALTGFEERIGQLPEGVNGKYHRFTRVMTLPSLFSNQDDVLLHELVHVYNHQFTGIGGITATSRSLDEGMAYQLQNVYAAAEFLMSVEDSSYKHLTDCASIFTLTESSWSYFWRSYYAEPPFDKNVPTLVGIWTLKVTYLDEMNLLRHLSAGLKCGELAKLVNQYTEKCCVRVSCKKSGPLIEGGYQMIYSGQHLPGHIR